MKILMLGDVHSSHFIKWVNSLNEHGFEIFIFTLEENKGDVSLDKSITVYYSGFSSEYKKYDNEGAYRKIKFLKSLPALRSLIQKIKPGYIHAHYASSYGLFGALSGFHPFYVSVWGSDIYSFPRRGMIHKVLIKYVLKRADRIFSTSRNMAGEINNYTSKQVSVIPFGINTDYFKPLKNEKSKELVIGTIKNLEAFYGIDILIRVFAVLKKNNPDRKLKLMIIGSGAKEKEFKELVSELNIHENTVFTGRVKYSDVAEFHNKIDIFANLSFDESFGVSVLEASACGVPVIASDAGGLPEVILNGETGFVVSLNNQEKIIEKFQELIDNDFKRREMGKKGREFVCSSYRWDDCTSKMISFYQDK